MLALEELKSELGINQELTEIVDALKVIAVTEFRELDERRKERSSIFLDAFERFFRLIDFSTVEHPYAKDTTGHLVLLMLTSDERFMGGLNKRIVDTALGYPGGDTAELVVMGTQGADYLRSLDRAYTTVTEVSSKKPYEAALYLREYILGKGLEAELGRLVIVYPKPMSFLVQTVEALPILPCTELLRLEKHERERRYEMLAPNEEVLIESSLDDLLEYLMSTWIAEKLLEVLEDSRQAELSAKAVRLEESYQTLGDNRKKLMHQYHRVHHEVLDKGMRETFSAQIMRR
ncbi:MAG: F0F1 ATP synthase subunit gamma [Candidatus Pacebacteria bacterium]|nr:F0F1 ATP synthase subunit gamma [Candidatus Paceibacterota bacterium]